MYNSVNSLTFVCFCVFSCMDQAACRALKQAKEKNIKKLVLYTDSKFTINGESKKMKCFLCMKPKWCNVDQSLVHLQHVTGPGLMIFIWTVKFEVCGFVGAGVTSWVKNWKLNNWRLKSGGPITNKDDFMKLDRLNAELEVVWVNISLHHLSLHPDLNPSLSC